MAFRPKAPLRLVAAPCLCGALLCVPSAAYAAGTKAPSGPGTTPGVAAAADATAETIIQQALNRSSVGLKRGTATLQMTIYSAKGEPKSRTLEIKAMRSDAGLLRSLVRFQKPAEVSGISFLVQEKKDSLPDQYVFVPAAKVVRRIAAGNATSSFFGSDFTFGDLMPLPASELSKLESSRLPDDKVGGMPVHVLKLVPKIEGSPYGQLIAYVDQKDLIPLKMEFFDPEMKLLKTLRVHKLKKIEGELVPVDIEMKAAAGTRTTLVIEAMDPKAKLSESDFTEEAMQR